jgi:hypothetical protein
MGEVAVGLIGLSDIKQRSSDADLLTMDRVARVMRENGWRFQFVSPEEMDRRMEELSARRRKFSRGRLRLFPRKVALTSRGVIHFHRSSCFGTLRRGGVHAIDGWREWIGRKSSRCLAHITYELVTNYEPHDT